MELCPGRFGSPRMSQRYVGDFLTRGERWRDCEATERRRRRPVELDAMQRLLASRVQILGSTVGAGR